MSVKEELWKMSAASVHVVHSAYCDISEWRNKAVTECTRLASDTDSDNDVTVTTSNGGTLKGMATATKQMLWVGENYGPVFSH